MYKKQKLAKVKHKKRHARLKANMKALKAKTASTPTTPGTHHGGH